MFDQGTAAFRVLFFRPQTAFSHPTDEEEKADMQFPRIQAVVCAVAMFGFATAQNMSYGADNFYRSDRTLTTPSSRSASGRIPRTCLPRCRFVELLMGRKHLDGAARYRQISDVCNTSCFFRWLGPRHLPTHMFFGMNSGTCQSAGAAHA